MDMAVAVRPHLHLVLGDLGQSEEESEGQEEGGDLGGPGENRINGGHHEKNVESKNTITHKGGDDTNEVFYVSEGEEISVTCVAQSVHPRPKYSWSQSRNILPMKSEPRIRISSSSYLVTSYHTVKLNITSTKMNMSTITCHTTQYDNAGNLLYSNNISGTILVSPFTISLPDTYQASSTTSLFFLLLLAVLGILTGEEERKRLARAAALQ